MFIYGVKIRLAVCSYSR